MSIAEKISRLQAAKTAIAGAITGKGGTVSAGDGYEEFPADIATIPNGVEEIATEAALDAKCVAANVGKIYKYVGETTAKYTQGEYYKIVSNDVEMDLTQVGSDKLWRTSSVIVSGFDMSSVTGIWESNNYHISNSKAVAKILIHGQTEFSLYINSYGENNYDYAIVSKVDANYVPTSYSGNNVKAHRRGNSSNPEIGIGNWTRVDFTSADGLDGGEHYVYVVYIKDSSADKNNDRGYVMISKSGYKAEICTVPTGEKSITTNGLHDVGGYKSARVDVPNPSTGTKTITSDGIYDVTDFASADVQVGGGGGGGHKIYYYHKIGTGDNGKMSVNGGDAVTLTTQMPDTSGQWVGSSAVLMGNVERFKIWGFWHRGSSVSTSASWARYRLHSGGDWTFINLTYDEASAQEITLSDDIDLEIYEGSCLCKGTLITMADGSYKPVEEIEVGDLVKGYDGNPQRVIRSQKGEKQYCEDRDIWIFERDYKIITTFRHRFYNYENQRMMYLNEWEIGDHAIAEDGTKVALIEHIHEDIPCMHFSLWCDGENYFAGGLLAGNRFTGEITIK